MKKDRGLGIFGKVFLYTLLFLFVVISITVGFFYRQFINVYDAGRQQQLIDIVQPLCDDLEGKSNEDLIEIAKAYHEKNTSIQFSIQASNGEILFETLPENQSTEKEDTLSDLPIENGNVAFNSLTYFFPLSNDITMSVYYTSDTSSLMEIITKTGFVIGILLLTTIIGAIIFARKITNPIKKLAATTKKMLNLELVEIPPVRKDEIGRLSKDVHKMYQHLKNTIADLENEVEYKREMEENQRYFLSAASHELKTPVTAASAMLESMLEGWVEPIEYPKYLRECLKMMNMQGKLITEIMDIVRLTDKKMQISTQSLNLNSIITSVIPTYLPISEAKEQKIFVSIPNTLMCNVDKLMFNRVISNLLMNAIQNTADHGEIRIFSEERNNEVTRLSILNTNTQINEEIISKLYEPFYRIDKARNKNQGRSGLGLTIVKKALDCMEIPFSLENTEEGVLFWMDLPIEK